MLKKLEILQGTQKTTISVYIEDNNRKKQLKSQ